LPVRKFALIFDNVQASHTHVIDFIRMLLTMHAIPVFSVGDPKIYDLRPVNNFLVIVTTREYPRLPSRFISRFAMIRLTPLVLPAATFIASRIMAIYGYAPERTTYLIKLISSVLQQFPSRATEINLLKFTFLLCHLPDKLDLTLVSGTIVWLLYYFSLHRMRAQEYANQFNFVFGETGDEDFDKSVLSPFLSFNNIANVTFAISKGTKSFAANVKLTMTEEFKDELTFLLNVYNTNSQEKIVIKLDTPVLCQIALIQIAIGFPGRHLVITGKDGSGRYSLTRFVAHIQECDFVNLSNPTPEEIMVPQDRLVTLHALLRDLVTNAVIHQKKTVVFVRHTHRTEVDVQLLCDFVGQRDFSTYFSMAALEDLYTRFSGILQATYEQRLTTHRQITNIIRMNITVVIGRNEGTRSDFYSERFDRLYLDTDSEGVFAAIAKSAFDGTVTRKVLMGNTSKLLDILPQIVDSARGKMPFFHPNCYYDFVDCFSHFAGADYQDVVSWNDNIQTALEFLATLETESRQIDRRLDSLAPTLQRLQVDSEALQASYSTRKEAIETRRGKLDDEHHQKQNEVMALDEEVAHLKQERDTRVPRIEQTLKLVEELTDGDIKPIRITANDPMPSLRLLLDVFCLILDRPVSYERSGQKLLMDPHFVEILVSKVTATTLSPELLLILETYFDKEALNPAELESIAPALTILLIG
jgi:hypothetical protein